MRLGDLWAKHGVGALRPDSAATKDRFIFGVTDDSRDVGYGTLFCALPGTKEDGLAFCSQAADSGLLPLSIIGSMLSVSLGHQRSRLPQ